MNQKFTEEEVRANIAANRRYMTTETELQLTAYADTLSKSASPMQVDIYPLPDSLYPQSKDWMAADYAGRVEWLHSMYENRKDELDCFLAAQGQGEAVAASPVGVPELHGWTLKLMRDRDGDMSIWACDPDGSSVHLAAAPSAPEGE